MVKSQTCQFLKRNHKAEELNISLVSQLSIHVIYYHESQISILVYLHPQDDDDDRDYYFFFSSSPSSSSPSFSSASFPSSSSHSSSSSSSFSFFWQDIGRCMLIVPNWAKCLMYKHIGFVRLCGKAISGRIQPADGNCSIQQTETPTSRSEGSFLVNHIYVCTCGTLLFVEGNIL